MKFSARVSLLAFTLAYGVASAASITYVDPFPSTSSPGSRTLTFNQFDESTGNMLSSINFSLTASVDGSVLFTNSNASASTFFNIPLTATAFLEDPFGNIVAVIRPTFMISSVTVPGASGDIPGTLNVAGTASDTGTGTLDRTSGLGSYADHGVTSYYSLSPFDIASIYIVDPDQGPIVMNFELVAGDISSDLLPDGVSATSFQNLSGTATLSYVYPDSGVTPIPEPATFMLLGSVLSGYGLWHARKRS